jgi:hypothetical protein
MRREIIGFPAPEAKEKLKEILEFLLANRSSNLTFEDVLPLLPPKTKKRDVMPFIRTWMANESATIERLKDQLSGVNEEIQHL